MSCGGGHLGFPIGIKNSNLVKDIPMIIPGHFGFNCGHRLTLDPMGKCSNAFYSETTNMNKAKLYMNVHWMVLYNLKVFCSEKKAFEHFPIGSNVNLCSAVVAILDFRSA
jgi:hypothetical protein